MLTSFRPTKPALLLGEVEWDILCLPASSMAELRMQALILRRLQDEGAQAVESDEAKAFIASALALTGMET